MRAAARGAALVLAIMVAALAVVIGAWLYAQAYGAISQAGSRDTREALWPYQEGIVDWVRLILMEDRNAGPVDSLDEPWATLQPDFQLAGGGHAQVHIEDAQGRFNLNTLMRNGMPSLPDIRMFRRLLAGCQLPDSLADAVLGWIGGVSGSDADAPYLSRSPPYRAARRLLTDVDELRYVQGFSADVIDRLRPFVSALPSANTTINVNTAPPEVLMALADGLSADWAQQIVAHRQQQPYPDTATFTAGLPAQVMLSEADAEIGVGSDYFTVSLLLHMGETDVIQEVLIHRAAGQIPDVVWRRNILN